MPSSPPRRSARRHAAASQPEQPVNPLQEEKAGGVSKRSKRAPARESVAVHPHKLIKIQLANAPPPEKRHIPVRQSMLNKGSFACANTNTANNTKKGSAASINADTANTKGSSASVNEEDSWLVLYSVNRGAAKGRRGDLRKSPPIDTIARKDPPEGILSVTRNNPPMDVMAREDLPEEGAAVSVAAVAAAPNTTAYLAKYGSGHYRPGDNEESSEEYTGDIESLEGLGGR